MNCRPWVTVQFALGTTVLRNRISLGIHVHSPDRHSILKLYLKKIIIFSNQYRNTNTSMLLISNTCTFWVFTLSLVFYHGGIIKQIMTIPWVMEMLFDSRASRGLEKWPLLSPCNFASGYRPSNRKQHSFL